jgi:hypothetical protein
MNSGESRLNKDLLAIMKFAEERDQHADDVEVTYLPRRIFRRYSRSQLNEMSS